MKEKAPYPEQVDVLFITVSLVPCTMLGTNFRYILSIYLISRWMNEWMHEWMNEFSNLDKVAIVKKVDVTLTTIGCVIRYSCMFYFSPAPEI